jgi:hypothetical protein
LDVIIYKIIVGSALTTFGEDNEAPCLLAVAKILTEPTDHMKGVEGQSAIGEVDLRKSRPSLSEHHTLHAGVLDVVGDLGADGADDKRVPLLERPPHRAIRRHAEEAGLIGPKHPLEAAADVDHLGLLASLWVPGCDEAWAIKLLARKHLARVLDGVPRRIPPHGEGHCVVVSLLLRPVHPKSHQDPLDVQRAVEAKNPVRRLCGKLQEVLLELTGTEADLVLVVALRCKGVIAVRHRLECRLGDDRGRDTTLREGRTNARNQRRKSRAGRLVDRPGRHLAVPAAVGSATAGAVRGGILATCLALRGCSGGCRCWCDR